MFHTQMLLLLEYFLTYQSIDTKPQKLVTSGAFRLKEYVPSQRIVFERNPKVRICIAAIALESVTEAIETIKNCEIEPCVTQISVSKTKAAGNLHMLTANNPVFLITGGCHE